MDSTAPADPSAHSLAANREKLARDMRAVVEDAEALLKLAVREAGTGYGEARTKLEKSLVTARSQLTELEKVAVDSAVRAGRAADAYVRENPWPVIGAGAGIGFVLGLLLSRR
jgi:ElaB/YqjD/DUF883 family membrane-anchored ribosome-binding protein